MTYLQLINNVLIRLREDTITAEQVDSDPYLRSIGAHVNDAKDRVEDAWQWGALRGTDNLTFVQGSASPNAPQPPDALLPNSDNSHYIIKRMFTYPLEYLDAGTGNARYEQDLNQAQQLMKQVTIAQMRERYRTPAKAGSGRPTEYAVTGTGEYLGFAGGSEPENLIKITVWPFPTLDERGQALWGFGVERVNHQPDLVNADDRLLVPSLPVYTLATALASRERGEVGGTPTSELFAIADRHLSDAIAQDSALYADEMIWYSAGEGWANTNVRTA